MSMERAIKKFLQALCKDLSWEYTAFIQYVQHTGYLRHAGKKEYEECLYKYACMACDDALKLSQIIGMLGGFPPLDICPSQTSKDISEMAMCDAETAGILRDRYQERIEQARQLSADDAVIAVLENNLAHKKEQIAWLESMLNSQ